ncbi:hypothetical protein JA1_003946 [Spathaspora sp. JA1]|nr:hypothetical protein JA1_003946 [Spathaspora sp. JA1]
MPQDILSLPDKILDLIFCHVNQATTSKAMLVNKKFHQVGLRKLYRNIYIFGSQLTPLSISSKADTPFHRQFTIVNDADHIARLFQSPHMNLVKNITLRGVSIKFKQEILEEWPWIKVVMESGRETDSGLTDVPKEIILRDWIPLEEDNYITKSLFIEISKPTKVLDLAPRMKSLEKVQLFGYDDDMFECLKLSVPPLKIKTLSIWILDIYTIEYEELERLFDLNEITSFEFSLEGMPNMMFERHSDQLVWLFSKLKNLENLAIQSCVFMPLIDSLMALPHGCLKKLYIGRPGRTLDFMEILEKYDCLIYSLKEFLFTTTLVRRGVSLLEEFDKVYKVNRRPGIQAKEAKAIRKLMQTDYLGYYSLRHIVLDRNHYTISWIGDKRVAIMPLN